MVQLRPRCWGPAAVGPARLIVPSDLEEERHAIPDNITVHVRVPITEDGDFFESYIPWDVTDTALKDADTFAVALGNDFGLSLEAVEEIARDISAQVKHMADVNPQLLQLVYLPHEAQLEAEAIQKAAEAEAAARRQQLLDMETTRQSATGGDVTAKRQREKEPGLHGYGPLPTGPTVPQAPAVGVEMWGHAPYQHHYEQQQQHQQPVGPVVQVDHGRKRKLGADGTAGEHGGSRGRDADPVVDGLLNDMPAELVLVLTALSQESERVLRAMRIKLQKCSGTCHDCRHTSEATVVCCPKDLLSHGLCVVHFERRHGLTHDQALAMASHIRDPVDANTPLAVPDNFPVCILCAMRCECRSCRRTHMRRVLDVVRRAVNLQAGLTEDEDHANLLSLPTPTTLSVPHSLLQDDVRRCLGGSGDPQTYGRKTGRPRKFESHVALPDKVYGFSPLHLENVSPSTITTALTYNRKSVTRKPRPDELMLLASQSAPVDADGPPPPPIILDAAAAGLSVADFGRGPADDVSSSTAGQTSMLSAITGLAEDDEGQGGKSHTHKRVKLSHGKTGVDGEQSPKSKPPRGKVFYNPPAKKGKGGRPSKGGHAKSAEQPVEYPNVNLEVCVACLKENDEELVDCQQCPRAYHVKCARLKPDEDKDEWLCDSCADDIDEPHASIISDTAESFRNAEKDCRAVLKVLMEHDLSGAFCEAVDLSMAPGYLDVISKPTHLGEIKENFFGTSAGRKAAKNTKFSVGDFILAVRRVWLNCQTYNEEGSVLYNIGDLLSQIFEANVEARLDRHMDVQERQELKGQTQAMEAEAEEVLTAVFVVPNGKSAKGKRASSPAALPSSAPPTATAVTTTTGERKRPGRKRKRKKQQPEKQEEQKESGEKGSATVADATDEAKGEEEEQEEEDEEVKVKQEDGVEPVVKQKQPPPAKKTKSKAVRVKKEEVADDDETESEGELPARAIPPKKTAKTGKRSEKKHAEDADATHEAHEGGEGEEDDDSDWDITAESQLAKVGPRKRRPSQRAAEAAEVAAPPPGKKRGTPGGKKASTGAEAGTGKAKGKNKAKAATPEKKKEGSPKGKAEKAEVITKSGRRSRGTG